ncbi:peptidyl-prolyl cis-trans isomerase PASTICCINO1 [Silene latifolia]|uniref:peptidyl-prolyl cis-trans isomerase PASTICCINO1 n=1 Tax=Silene latifolia TaxID=37657 RepID=UPI003D77BC59
MAVSEIDDHDATLPKKKQLSEDDKRRLKVVPGGLLKAEVRPGGGDASPSDGDQVIYHFTVRTLEGYVVRSTKKEFGGKGSPLRDVLGKSKLILGLMEGIPTMKKGEIAMFKMKPEMHFGEKDCPVPVPDNFPTEDDLHFEIELIDFGKAKVISEDLGVVKKVLYDGQGWETPRAPYEVKAWISAKSNDGKLIWSHIEGEPFFFTFGNSGLPKGLEMGIGTMTRGEKSIIYVRNQYLTECSILPDATSLEEVHFEVDLVHFVQVRDVLGDGRLIKRRIRDGRGDFPMDCPLQDSRLRVHYKAMLQDDKKSVFYDTRVNNDGQPLEFSSGEGLVPEGFEMCVRLMLPGEIALVTCPPDYAYDKFPRPADVPAGAYVEWEIELLGFDMVKDWTGLDFRSIMAEAENIRCTGNRLFKEGKYELAKAKYDKVLRDFNHVNPQDDEEGKEFLNSRNALHLNVAACYLKMGECRKSIETCDKVLDANPVHAKAFYRRGMAYMELGDFEEAKSDFNMMMKVDKSSEADAKAALQKLKQREQEAARKAKQQFKGLFDKRPGEIADVSSDKVEQVTDSKNPDSLDNDDLKVEAVEKRHRGKYIWVGLVCFLVCLGLVAFFLMTSGGFLGDSVPPDSMPVDEYNEL